MPDDGDNVGPAVVALLLATMSVIADSEEARVRYFRRTLACMRSATCVDFDVFVTPTHAHTHAPK